MFGFQWYGYNLCENSLYYLIPVQHPICSRYLTNILEGSDILINMLLISCFSKYIERMKIMYFGFTYLYKLHA